MPARREGLSHGVGVERIHVDVGEVESIPGTHGESDRDQPHATAYRAPDAGIHSWLERGLDFDVEDISLQSAGHLIDPLGVELDGGSAPSTVGGDNARFGIGQQAGDEVSAVSVNRIKELIERVAKVITNLLFALKSWTLR